MSGRDSIFVETPARLHFGVLDLSGRLGRCFGGLGAAIPSPSLLLEAALSGDIRHRDRMRTERASSPPDSSPIMDSREGFVSTFIRPFRVTPALARVLSWGSPSLAPWLS